MEEEIAAIGPYVAVSIDNEHEVPTTLMLEIASIDGEPPQVPTVSMSQEPNDGERDVSPIALKVAASMEGRLKALDGRSIEDAQPTIWKIPQDIREDNASAYDPEFISIGPYHHGRPELKPMEDVKLLYVQHLLARDGMNKLKYYADEVLKYEKEARKRYSEAFDGLSSEAFVEILVQDGCFLVEFLLKRAEGKVGKPLTTHMRNMPTLRRDLLLLENQVPFFVLQIILNETAYEFGHENNYTLLDLALHYLYKGKMTTEISGERYGNEEQGGVIEGIYHLLHLSYLCLNLGLEPRNVAGGTTIAHAFCQHRTPTGIFLFPFVKLREIVSVVIIGFLYAILSSVEMLFMWNKPGWYASRKEVPEKPRMVPTATELQEAGVLIKKKDHVKDLNLDVSFCDGVLEIPLVKIQANTNSMFRNILAFEQSCPAIGNNFLSYIVLMDNLINTAEDVVVLKRAGILESKLGCDEDVARFFNSIRRGTFFTFNKHYLVHLFKDVNGYCNVDHNRWRAKLVHDYFGSPWSVLSLIAALAALVMTAMQTYYDG